MVSAVVAHLARGCHWHRGVRGRPGLWHLQTCRRRARRGRNRVFRLRDPRAGGCGEPPIAFALAFALAAEPLPRNRGYRVQLQGFCQRVVRLWVFARGAQKGGGVRLMDFVVFWLVLHDFLPRKRLCRSIP